LSRCSPSPSGSRWLGFLVGYTGLTRETLAPRTARAIGLAIGEHSEGPVFLAAGGGRLDRHGAGRIARRAGITKPAGPHTLRRAFIAAALGGGVSLREVQEAASRRSPDHHAIRPRPRQCGPARDLRPPPTTSLVLPGKN
jgi:integrase